jgi:sialate O-acetylesterase
VCFAALPITTSRLFITFMRLIQFLVVLLLFCRMAVTPAVGVPRFANIFTDNTVLQRDSKLTVWGFGAEPGQALMVRLGTIEAKAEIERDGCWSALLPLLTASSEGRKMTLEVDGKVVALIRNVLIGDVWLAAGQSNMQFPVRGMLKHLPEAKAWVGECNLPNIRWRRINDPVAETRDLEATDLNSADAWNPMTPESVVGFSAVAAVYARELHEKLSVPIGVIDVSWGGKPIEPFIPREAFDSPLLRRIRKLADAGRIEELARTRGGLIIRNPEGYPGAIFNARMAPLAGLGLQGFVWYQAESNCGRGEDPREYRHKMSALVQGWRERWANPKLPFYFVQLPSFPKATGWIRMREEQRRALNIPLTGMAVTIDVRGEGIHPPDKLSVGRRLARLALVKTYHAETGDATGPLYESHQIEGRSVRVRFENAASGLMVGKKSGIDPALESAPAKLRWFEIADESGNWHAATATIDRDEVVVVAEGVRRPTAVRYACEVQPQGGNLYNRAGFAASPFCTDLKLLPWIDPGPKR